MVQLLSNNLSYYLIVMNIRIIAMNVCYLALNEGAYA